MEDIEFTPDLPVPPGATADDWHDQSDNLGPARFLTWSTHDAADVGVAVTGEQFADGRIDRRITVYDANSRNLNAAQARMVAAGLLNAADALDQLR